MGSWSPCRVTFRRTWRCAFSESASRAVVAVAPERVEQLADLAAARGVPFADDRKDGRAAGGVRRVIRDDRARAPRRVRGRDPAAVGRGRVIRAVTFDYWETLVSEGAGIDAEEDGTMRARQLRPLVEILAAAGMPVSDADIDAAFGRNWESSTRAGGPTSNMGRPRPRH